jgi:glycolate oxidase
MLASRVIKELRTVTGTAHVRTDPEILAESSTDATKIAGSADVVVFPENAAEVSQIVKLANRERVPIVSRGGGVGYAGGAIPMNGGIVVSMRRMNRILEIHPVDLVAVLEPGVITEELHKAAEAYGLFYPPDPASLKQSTLGGNVAHNAGGPRAFKYGVTRNYLMGMEVVLPTGEIVNTGGRVVKNAVAYDLTDLMCGSEGTLGIITKLTMRLVPKPETALTVVALFDSVRKCADAAGHLISARVIPSKMELLDRQSVAAIRRYVEAEKLPITVALPEIAAALLLVEVDGDVPGVRRDLDRVKHVLAQSAISLQGASNSDELWTLRRYLSPAVGRIRPNKINEDIVVPRSCVGDYLVEMEKLQSDSGLPIVCFGHLGDGNIHVNLMLDMADPAERKAADRIKLRIFELAVRMGGTISGEHGIGIMKSEFLPMALSAEAIAAMKSIKRVLDPNNIMNPGKIFP